MKTILVDAFHTFVIKDQGIFTEMHQLLETYPNNKIILTNANDQQVIEFWLTNLPYPLFSLKHNPDKIDPTYFETMLQHFNLKAEEVIYFEHDTNAIESAKSVGITSYHYDETIKDLEKLKTFLDENL